MPLTLPEYAIDCCAQQRLAQRVHRADVGFRRARAHRDAYARARELHAAVGGHEAVIDQLLQDGVRDDHEVDRLTALEPARDGVRARADRRGGGDDLVVCDAFELGYEREVSGRERPRRRDAHVCEGAARKQQQSDERASRGMDASRALHA